jgi:hypothetical protein
MIRVLLVTAAYISAQMLSDIASLKIIMFVGFSMDAGTLIYPITFTLRDLVHKTIGARGARVLIVLAAGINLIMAAFFWLVSVLPPDLGVGPQAEFAIVLAPVWRIVIASICAETIAELIDTEGYSLWKRWFGQRWQIGRVLFSNAISVPIDSAIFCALAFYGVLPNEVVMGIFVANVLLKGIVTILSSPLIRIIPDKKVSLG